MNKKTETTKKTRRNLMKNFYILYKKNDLNKITVKNICDQAKLDRTTFYRYFDNVEDILNKFEDEIITKIQNDIKGNENHNSNNILFEGFNSFNTKYGKYLIVFHRNGNQNFYNKFKSLIKNDVYNYFNFNIENENKKEYIYEFMFSSIINSYIYWYNHKEIVDIKTFIKFSNIILKNGINIFIKEK